MRKIESKNQLYEAILSLKNIEDCEKFFADLCTIKEVEAMAQRFHAAILLMENKTYEQIIDETEISSATLSRVSKCIQYGDGGYASVISRIKK